MAFQSNLLVEWNKKNRKPKIVVIGSSNMDMIVRTDRIPQRGETVLGGKFIQSRGGKGANQAVAAARLGADVAFVTCLGKDQFGQDMFQADEEGGIDTRYITWDEETPTGVALIVIDAAGEDIICVAPGANEKLSPEDIDKAEETIKSADCVLLQLEVPMQTVEYAVKLASKHHVRVVLNPAPMASLSEELLEMVHVLTPNETEASALIKNHAANPRDLPLVVMHKFNIRNVVVTLGKEGADVAAVVFSANPIAGNRNEVIINASWGLGESIVGGTVTPDTFIVRKSDLAVINRVIADKQCMTVSAPGGTHEVETPRFLRHTPSLNDEQVIEIAKLALTLETSMEYPVDVECAYAGGQLYLLQCRPITTLK